MEEKTSYINTQNLPIFHALNQINWINSMLLAYRGRVKLINTIKTLIIPYDNNN